MRWALGLCAVLWVATVVGAIGLIVGTIRFSYQSPGDQVDVALGFALLGIDAIVYACIGALLVARQPRNAVGWILLATGPMMVITFSGFAFGTILYQRSGPDDFSAGLSGWIGGLFVGPTVLLAGPLLCLVFPDGVLPGPRWRLPVIAVVGALVGGIVIRAFQPGPLGAPLAKNPFGIESPWLRSLVPSSGPLWGAAVFGGAALAIAAVAVRFHRSTGLEREQVKWLVASSAVLIVAMALSFTPLFDGPRWGLLVSVALILVPVSVWIAVTRYRLYEIDRIISRTLAYALLTATLAIVYVSLIIALQALLAPLTTGSTLAISASTLLVATVFAPLRNRIRTAVERQFNRARYDQSRTVEEMAGRLSDLVDVDELKGVVASTVDKTLQPTTIGIWLRRAPAR